MTGAIPVFLPPTRNHLGIIGPIPLEEFKPENIQKRIEANPFARAVKRKKPRILTITQSTYDGVLYNVEMLKDSLNSSIDTLHFDEAWLPARDLPRFSTRTCTRSARTGRAPRMRSSTPPTRRTNCSPAFPRRRRSSCRNRRPRKLDRHAFNEAYLMHTSTSPQYAIIAFLRRGRGDDGAARRHGAGRGIDHRSARFPPRHAQGRRGIRQGLVVQRCGPGKARRGGHRFARGLDSQVRREVAPASAILRPASTCSTRSRPPSSLPAWMCPASSPRPVSPRRS